MHTRIIFGNNFQGCLDYVFGKPGARMVGKHQLAGQTPIQWASQFDLIASQSQRIQKPVMHVDLSPHPDDRMSDKAGIAFARKYFQGLGMDCCQWVLAEHTDAITPEGKPRPHFHAIANRIPLNQTKAVNSSWLGLRSQQVLRELRAEFGLRPVRESEAIERKPPSVGQERRYRRERQECDRFGLPELPVKVQLQNAIDEATREPIALPALIQRLQQQAIAVRVRLSREGRATGISYCREGVAFSGTQLGRTYTLPGLQKHRGVDCETPSDFTTFQPSTHLSEMSNPTPSPPSPEELLQEQQEQWVREIAPILQRLLDYYEKDELENDRYEIHRLDEGRQISVDRKEALSSPILGVKWEGEHLKIWASRLQVRDVEHFQTIGRELAQIEENEVQSLETSAEIEGESLPRDRDLEQDGYGASQGKQKQRVQLQRSQRQLQV